MSLTFFGEPPTGGPAAAQVLRRLVVQFYQARASTSNNQFLFIDKCSEDDVFFAVCTWEPPLPHRHLQRRRWLLLASLPRIAQCHTLLDVKVNFDSLLI